jgi:hypothetical protein
MTRSCGRVPTRSASEYRPADRERRHHLIVSRLGTQFGLFHTLFVGANVGLVFAIQANVVAVHTLRRGESYRRARWRVWLLYGADPCQPVGHSCVVALAV